MSKPYVVFGYGSLIWKPPPHVIEETPGFLKGYVRRFAQSSNDHRGTPEVSPIGPVTLIHIDEWNKFSSTDIFPHEDVVWGIAYTIAPVYAAETKTYLDYREKNGYSEATVDVWGLRDGEEVVIRPNVYVGQPDNPAFVGSEPYDKLAKHIWSHQGASGQNKDYLYKLSESIRRLAPESHDSHLFTLERMVRAIDAAEAQDFAVGNGAKKSLSLTVSNSG
ncbi:ChaC-like protein [Cantharellus anzutake]|uniref:ChaC-like protein n=1 Tax=Cantharellus anzutake TaxID=1750568 RepID=UPI001907FC92|nr:ChaC-like protein [Cantharellus anzutake]XP_038915404.1 ChaC-like protein [Cantharellus anzutake]KAF8310907.1 ChaC-like protein [Cantharellus anzutake]KAF8330316.1 ChaC-like protein [Cantharellus anzutake]